MITELTESLSNYIFPGMIDTTTDSVQQVASKLNGAKVTTTTSEATPQQPSNLTQIVPDITQNSVNENDVAVVKPINQSATALTDDPTISASLPSLLVSNIDLTSSNPKPLKSSKGPSTLASLLFPDMALNTLPPLKNSTLSAIIPSILLPSLTTQDDNISPTYLNNAVNVSVSATPIDNMEYETPAETQHPENPATLPITESITDVLPIDSQSIKISSGKISSSETPETVKVPSPINPPIGKIDDNETPGLPGKTSKEKPTTLPVESLATGETVKVPSPINPPIGGMSDEKRPPMAISIQPEPEDEDTVKGDDGSTAPLYSGEILF